LQAPRLPRSTVAAAVAVPGEMRALGQRGSGQRVHDVCALAM
jgi:hypothetical protein